MLTRNRHSLSSLASWLRTKNPQEEYSFINNSHCLISQYLSESYSRPISCNAHEYHFTDTFSPSIPLPPGFNHVALPGGDPDTCAGCDTFGRALARCETLLSGGEAALEKLREMERRFPCGA